MPDPQRPDPGDPPRRAHAPNANAKEAGRAEFIARLVKDPKQPPETLLLTGFLGDAADREYTRLYFDAELNDYVDIPTGAILHTQELPREESPLGESLVWIQREATLLHSRAGGEQTKAKFLEGPLFQEFLQSQGAGLAEQPLGLEAAGLFPFPTRIHPLCPTRIPWLCHTRVSWQCPTRIPQLCPTRLPQLCPSVVLIRCPTVLHQACPTRLPQQCITRTCTIVPLCQPTRVGCPTVLCPQTQLCPVTQVVGCQLTRACPQTQLCPATQVCPVTQVGCQSQLCPSAVANCPTLVCPSAVDACPSAPGGCDWGGWGEFGGFGR